MHGENISNLVWDLLFRQLKSKACPFDKLRAGSEQRRRIQNLEWLGLSVLAFLLVVAGAVAWAQQPRKSRGSAKQIGVTIPQSVLYRADKSSNEFWIFDCRF